MLNGIGGRTIEQAVANLSVNELYVWQRYRAKHGSLNAADRNEYMLAQYMTMYGSAHGMKNASIYDFAPALERPKMELGDALKAAGMLGK